jgi:hypothetical protein
MTSFVQEAGQSDENALPSLASSGLFFGLQGKSPESGSFLEFGWRLLGMFGPKSSNIGLQRLLAMRKARIWRPFSSEEGNSLKRTLPG